MNNENIDIGHYARIPMHIARAKVSENAKAVWREMAFFSSPEKPEIWVRQENMAEKLGLSIRTIRRLLEQLEERDLIIHTGWVDGRYKKYRLIWQANASDTRVLPPRTSVTQVGQPCPASPDIHDRSRRTPVSDHPGHRCPPINRVLTKQDQIIFSQKKAGEILQTNPEQEAQNLLANYGEEWAKRFACLDGFSGRPSVQECVEQALNHNARHKCLNLKIYLESWLRNASKSWVHRYFHELSAAPTDPGLSPEAVERKLQLEKERKAKLERKRLELQPQIEPFSEQLDWSLMHAVLHVPKRRAECVTD